MISKHQVLASALIAGLLLLGGCSASLQRPTPTASGTTTVVPRPVLSAANPLGRVTLDLSDATKKKLGASMNFSGEQLRGHIEQALRAGDLLAATPAETMPALAVHVTGVRVRSVFNAVMWGFMAGADSMEGDVELRTAEGQVADQFHVAVSYALGGLVGGQDGMRMEWMYRKFAEQIVNALRPTAGAAGR